MILLKLSNLKIQELYGVYNYDVTFNDDVTFLYGSNGCGKTTILNITEAIITGCLYKLFNYQFASIELFYSDSSKHAISIKPGKPNNLTISFKDEFYDIYYLDLDADDDYEPEVIQNAYFQQFDVLAEISQTFNYVYLPLNRSSDIINSNFDYFHSRRLRFLSPLEDDKVDSAIRQVEMLIHNEMRAVNIKISRITSNFRNQILRQSVDINDDYSIIPVLTEIDQSSESKIDNICDSYLKVLNSLSSLTPADNEKYTAFFASIKSLLCSSNPNDLDGSESFELVIKYREIMRIKKILEIDRRAEELKQEAKSNIELFTNTINNFLSVNEEGKHININEDGHIEFCTKYSEKPISIYDMSSGERQLLIFFANLLFNVGKQQNGIFVVDEPELSLHLFWQRMFVESVMKVNPNVQLIFATHSPEFVGKYRDKLFKLERRINRDYNG